MGQKKSKFFWIQDYRKTFTPEVFPERTSNKKIKILWVGRLFALKGLPLVLEALSKVGEDVDFELTILGDGPMGKYIENGYMK
jgi:glycosyltransferase involved in cell wall biosynthesis